MDAFFYRTRMPRMRRIFTDFFLGVNKFSYSKYYKRCVKLTDNEHETLIREDPSHPWHPCSIQTLRNRIKHIVLFCILLVVSCNLPAQTRSDIDEFILDQMETHHLPGLSACIILGDQVVWHKNYGYMDLHEMKPVHDSTLFTVFSISKSVSAVCAMQLWEQGLLDLDGNINNTLPFLIDSPWVEDDSITSRMLMSHSARINDRDETVFVTIGDPVITLSYFMENYFSRNGEYWSNTNFFKGMPGTLYKYSSYGTALNSYLVEVISGIDFSIYSKTALLGPLEMDGSAWYLEELNMDNLATGHQYTAGQYIPCPHYGHPAYPSIFLRSTTLELANFVIMLLNQGIYKGEQILLPAAIDSMTTVQNPNWGTTAKTGLGLFQRTNYGNRFTWGHNGRSGGYAAHMHFCKEENSAVVIMANSEQYVHDLVEYLFDYALIITGTLDRSQHQSLDLVLYPNPVLGAGVVRYQISDVRSAGGRTQYQMSDLFVDLGIYDLRGQKVMTLIKEKQKAGLYERQIDLSGLSAGIYLLKLQEGSKSESAKLIKF